MPKPRILIVEDDVFIAADVEAIVSQAVDAEVLVSNSVAGAKKLITPSIDLAFLDIDVTNGQTFEIAIFLRSRSVPFVFLSGSPRETVPPELRDAPFIPKPHAERQLLDQIRRLMPERSSEFRGQTTKEDK